MRWSRVENTSSGAYRWRNLGKCLYFVNRYLYTVARQRSSMLKGPRISCLTLYSVSLGYISLCLRTGAPRPQCWADLATETAFRHEIGDPVGIWEILIEAKVDVTVITWTRSLSMVKHLAMSISHIAWKQSPEPTLIEGTLRNMSHYSLYHAITFMAKAMFYLSSHFKLAKRVKSSFWWCGWNVKLLRSDNSQSVHMHQPSSSGFVSIFSDCL
jgi:hypothetical protein